MWSGIWTNKRLTISESFSKWIVIDFEFSDLEEREKKGIERERELDSLQHCFGMR